MKHNRLHSVAHNFADSLAGGLSFVVPGHVLHTHVFAEAAANKNRSLTIDFLTGQTTGTYPEGDVEETALLLKTAFPGFCDKHGVDVQDFETCTGQFSSGSPGNRYVITVKDKNGRSSAREYLAPNGKRAKPK